MSVLLASKIRYVKAETRKQLTKRADYELLFIDEAQTNSIQCINLRLIFSYVKVFNSSSRPFLVFNQRS
jgi:hypothetical protein